MKKIKNILFIILGIIILPNIVNAATLTLEGSTSGNTATYNVINSDAIEENGSIKLKISKTNDDLTYLVSSQYGDCNTATLSCTLLFPSGIDVNQTIATVTIKNNSSESKETTITLPSELGASSKTFTVNAGAEATTTQKTKSNNPNLTSINLSQGTFDTTFNQDTLSYVITGIKDTINSITITPNCDNCTYTITCPNGECSVSNNKKISLQTGSNKVSITTKSEDDSQTKTYNLEIYRGDIPVSSAYLTSLKIEDVKLSPTFNSMNNEYTGTFTKKLKKFNITYEAEDPNATVEIKNVDTVSLKKENKITITVTSSDGENIQVYTLTLSKEEEKTTTKLATTKVNKKKNNTLLIVICILIGLVLIGGVTFIFFKKKKKKNNKDDNDKNNGLKDTNSLDETKVLEEQLEETYEDLENNEESEIEKENTESLRVLEETRKEEKEEPKQDIDDALDDLMKTKKLELGDLDF